MVASGWDGCGPGLLEGCLLLAGAGGVAREVLPGEAWSAGLDADLSGEAVFVAGVLGAGVGGVLVFVDGVGVCVVGVCGLVVSLSGDRDIPVTAAVTRRITALAPSTSFGRR